MSVQSWQDQPGFSRRLSGRDGTCSPAPAVRGGGGAGVAPLSSSSAPAPQRRFVCFGMPKMASHTRVAMHPRLCRAARGAPLGGGASHSPRLICAPPYLFITSPRAPAGHTRLGRAPPPTHRVGGGALDRQASGTDKDQAAMVWAADPSAEETTPAGLVWFLPRSARTHRSAPDNAAGADWIVIRLGHAHPRGGGSAAALLRIAEQHKRLTVISLLATPPRRGGAAGRGAARGGGCIPGIQPPTRAGRG